MTAYQRITVSPIAGALGAEIGGVDIAAGVDDATIAEIRRALLEHLVIFFRDQRLDDDTHKAFSRRFGELFIHPNYDFGQAEREIVRVVRAPGDERIVGEEWHTDTTMMREPPMGSILYALEVPPYGGDTLFANQYLAYESLSEGMKTMLAGLKVVHSDIRVAGPQAGLNARRSSKVREDANWRPTENVHPGRAHPSGDRPQVPVREPLLFLPVRRHDRPGEPPAARLPDESWPSARIHLPVPLADRIDRVLG